MKKFIRDGYKGLTKDQVEKLMGARVSDNVMARYHEGCVCIALGVSDRFGFASGGVLSSAARWCLDHGYIEVFPE